MSRTGLSRNIKGAHFAVGFDLSHQHLPKGATNLKGYRFLTMVSVIQKMFAITILLALPLTSGQLPGTDKDKEVLAAERTLFEALKEKDATDLAKLLGDELQFRNAAENPIGKTEFINSVISVAGVIQSISSDDMRVRMVGELAIVTGTQKAVVSLGSGREAMLSSDIFTDVFVNRGGRWLLVFAHSVELLRVGVGA
jgi:hypothetical protein